MTGEDTILFEDANIQLGPNVWALIDAEVNVYWTFEDGELSYRLLSWSGIGGGDFFQEMASSLTRELNIYASGKDQRQYIIDRIQESNGLHGDPYAEHRLTQSAFL